MNPNRQLCFPASNPEYRSDSLRVRSLCNDFVRQLRVSDVVHEDCNYRIANLCDGIGELSYNLVSALPNAAVDSVDLGFYSEIIQREGTYDARINYHSGTDLIEFIEGSRDSYYDLITLVRARFIFHYDAYSHQGLTEAMVQSNVERLLYYLPRKIKRGGFLYIQSAHLNPSLINGLKDEGFEPLDPDEWFWINQPIKI